MTTWSQIGVHLKPVILLNVNNFYSSLRDFINKYARSSTLCACVSRRRHPKSTS
jgi:predicted Rossmann-fold nucleotide-binding protein